MKGNGQNFGTEFERLFVAILAFGVGMALVYLALLGPLWLGRIQYKTAAERMSMGVDGLKGYNRGGF